MQIQISWLLQKPTDLDLHCLQGRVYPGSAGQGLTSLPNMAKNHLCVPNISILVLSFIKNANSICTLVIVDDLTNSA